MPPVVDRDLSGDFHYNGHFSREAQPEWGFEPHRLINKHAVFTLPPGMLPFYKHHIRYLTNEAVAADHRRYAVEEEAPRHYIDLDYYGSEVPHDWEELIDTYPLDSIKEHGTLPWNLYLLKYRLTEAFRVIDVHRILKLSADCGHYLADAHVPLHTTSNYNGQFTQQHGIHGFWETRIPELFYHDFDLWVGKAMYREDWYDFIWEVVWQSHHGVDSTLQIEKALTLKFDQDKKYSYEVRLSSFRRVYSQLFSQEYHRLLDNQVEKRFRSAIRAIGDFWYTCWVDAGQPNLPVEYSHSPVNDPYSQLADSIWRYSHEMRRE